MTSFVEVDLLPRGIKKLMSMLMRVSLVTEVCVILLLSVMCFIGVFDRFLTGAVFSVIVLLLSILLMLPLRFNKVSQSTVRLDTNHLYILDKKGKCWRTIDRNTITAVYVKDISGFFYGKNKDMFQNKYVCIFLNGTTEIPNVPFAEMFTAEDFIMIGYSDEVLRWYPLGNDMAERPDGHKCGGCI